MAAIERTPPQLPRWQLTIDEDERGYLLAAFDFALQILHGTYQRPAGGAEWPLPAHQYIMKISHLEQVVASVNPRSLSDG